MTTAIQVVLAQNLKIQLCQYLMAYSKFAVILNISINPSSDLLFTVVNENRSCYSSLKLQGIRLTRQLSSEIDPSSAIFSQSYQQPLKALLFHLQCLQSIETLLLEFTQDSLHFGTEPAEGSSSSWRSLLQPVVIENPIFPPVQQFPVCISGFSGEWFHFLLEGVSSAGLLSKSTLIMKVAQESGLTLILPGTNRAEIELGAFNFWSFQLCDIRECAVMVNLREMAALIALATKMTSKIDFYFGPIGYPLVAVLSSIGVFECKFVLATVPADSERAERSAASVTCKRTTDSDDEYISGTDDES